MITLRLERKKEREGYKQERWARKERERAFLEEMSAISLKSPKTPINRQKVGKKSAKIKTRKELTAENQTVSSF